MVRASASAYFAVIEAVLILATIAQQYCVSSLRDQKLTLLSSITLRARGICARGSTPGFSRHPPLNLSVNQ